MYHLCSGICILLKVWKLFSWLKLFPEPPGYFIAQLGATYDAIVGFITLLFIVILGFAIFFYMINHNAELDARINPHIGKYHYVGSFMGYPAIDALISMYLISLGDFADRGGLEKVPDDSIDKIVAWVMFLLACFFIQIIFMNMVIALMSHPFGEV